MALTDEHPLNIAITIGHSNDWHLDKYTPENKYSIVAFSRSGVNMSRQHKRSRDGKYREGGSWAMHKEEHKHSLSADVKAIRYGYEVPAYEGQFNVGGHVIWFDYPPMRDLATQSAQLRARGAEAWNRLRPDLPDFSIATSLWEMKDFFPIAKDMLKDIVGKVADVNIKRVKSGKSELSKAAQGHLAASFGYLPLLSDIRKYVDAQYKKQKRLSQLIRDAGKPVRRRTTLVDNSTNQQEGLIYKYGYNYDMTAYMQPVLVTQCYAFAADCGATTRYDYVSKTWAEGSFYYYLPPGPRDVAWTKKMMGRIMGQRITPRELYQVVPWSWLADYFTTLGDFIGATSPGVADNLVCDYAYLMQTKIMRFSTTASQRIRVVEGGSSVLLNASLVTTRSAKCREPASPFGWGLKQSDLNLKQKSILVALGLANLP